MVPFLNDVAVVAQECISSGRVNTNSAYPKSSVFVQSQVEPTHLAVGELL